MKQPVDFLTGHANQWYVDVADALIHDGQPVVSRGRAVHEALHTVLRMEHPRRRVLTVPFRRANPFFQAAETVWILAGRADAQWILPYNRQLGQFLDTAVPRPGYFHGAYGERLRRWDHISQLGEITGPSVDQLRHILDQLRKDPGSRRAVAVLHNPRVDNPWVDTLDRPCLAGETVLWSPEGDLPISQVALKFDRAEVERWPVYAVDVATLGLRLTWATKVWKTGAKATVRIGFNDGSAIRCTPDHRLFIKRWVGARPAPGRGGAEVGGWQIDAVAAGTLRPGDRVLATRRWYGKKGHEWHKRQLDVNTSYDNRVWTHQEYAELLWGPVPPEHDVHHQNETKTDNRASNLQVLEHGAHAALKVKGDRNPMRQLSAEQHWARAAKHSVALRRWWASHGLTPGCRCPRCCAADNHVVTSVTADQAVEVYDFTVPGEHTALVGTGVVAHNCNIALSVQQRDGQLHLAVFNRSNDLTLGLAYTNIVQFTTLQEFLAAGLGLDVGTYTHVSSSLHVYADDQIARRCINQRQYRFDAYDYVDPVRMRPWTSNGEGFDVVEELAAKKDSVLACPYWESVRTMLRVWGRFKAVADSSDPLLLATAMEVAIDELTVMAAKDWMIAALEFLHRWACKRGMKEEFEGYLRGPSNDAFLEPLLRFITHDDAV